MKVTEVIEFLSQTKGVQVPVDHVDTVYEHRNWDADSSLGPPTIEVEFNDTLPNAKWQHVKTVVLDGGGQWWDAESPSQYTSGMAAKSRGRRVAFQNNIAPRLNSGQITARKAFTSWNRSFQNPSVRDYNESLWRYKTGRRKTAPDYRAMGVRKEVADASEEVVDQIAARR